MPKQKSQLLTLDLGLTTGYAVLNNNGKVIFKGKYDWRDQERSLKLLLSAYTPTHVLAETPVIIRGPLGEKLDHVVSQVRLIVGSDLIEIDPARWKNSWWGGVRFPGRKMSRHVQDAIRMGWWFLEVELKRSNIRANVGNT